VVILQAKVNNRGPFTFVLDTGASGSLINLDFAKQVELPLTKGEMKVMSPSGPLDSYETQVDSIATSFKTMENRKLAVAPLSHLNPDKSNILAGILGYDFLKGTELIIDYPRQKIAIISQITSNTGIQEREIKEEHECSD
jgi:predicted aspartyl protease